MTDIQKLEKEGWGILNCLCIDRHPDFDIGIKYSLNVEWTSEGISFYSTNFKSKSLNVIYRMSSIYDFIKVFEVEGLNVNYKFSLAQIVDNLEHEII